MCARVFFTPLLACQGFSTRVIRGYRSFFFLIVLVDWACVQKNGHANTNFLYGGVLPSAEATFREKTLPKHFALSSPKVACKYHGDLSSTLHPSSPARVGRGTEAMHLLWFANLLFDPNLPVRPGEEHPGVPKGIRVVSRGFPEERMPLHLGGPRCWSARCCGGTKRAVCRTKKHLFWWERLMFHRPKHLFWGSLGVTPSHPGESWCNPKMIRSESL